MKKALSFILALILSLSVFVGVTVFADEVVLAPELLELKLYGYYEGGYPENLTVGIEQIGYAFTGLSCHLEDADGENVSGVISAGVSYKLIVEIKTGEQVSLEGIKKEKITISGWGASNIPGKVGVVSASDFKADDDSYVIEFELPAFYFFIDSLSFNLEGYEIGGNIEDVVVTSDTYGVLRCDPVFYEEKPVEGTRRASGEIKAGIAYYLSVYVDMIPGYSPRKIEAENVELQVNDSVLYSNKMPRFMGGNYYGMGFFLPALEEPVEMQMYGDMDGDGEITVSDALRALRIAARLDVTVMTKGTRSEILGDVDGDGEVTVADALSILRIAAKLA